MGWEFAFYYNKNYGRASFVYYFLQISKTQNKWK